MTTLEIAQAMFNAYGQHCEWKTFDGRDMPRWDGINDVVRSHWMAVAEWAEVALVTRDKVSMS